MSTPGNDDERPGLLARRSSAFLEQLTALEPGAAAEAVTTRHLEATACLLGRDWISLVEHIRGDGPCPPGVAWRAGYALDHLGHHRGSARVLASVDPDTAAPGDAARLAAVAAGSAWLQGDTERCREQAATALAHARTAADDPGAAAWAWVVHGLLAASDGDRDLNLTCYERALALAQRGGDVLTQERVLNNLASRSLEEGRSTEALELLAQALVLNETTGFLSGLAMLRHNSADALLGTGRVDEALVECDAARALWTSLEAPTACMSWQLRGEIQVARGNATQAAHAYARAAELAEAEGDAQTRALALAGHAAALVGTDPVAAAGLADQALELDRPVGQAVPVVVAGWVRLATGDLAGARDLAARAVELAGRHRDLPSLADSLELSALVDHVGGPHPDGSESTRSRAGAEGTAATRDDGSTGGTGGTGGEPTVLREGRADAQLREAAAIWRELDRPIRLLVNEVVVAARAQDRLALQVAGDELRSLGVHDDAWRIAGALQAVAALTDSADVRVHLLGSFSVEVRGTAVAGSAWPSRKTREVLKVLACRGSRGITRARLGALVWPDAGAVGNRLSVALSHLRSVLDPGRVHPGDHYVIADGGTVRLDVRHVEVDLEVFLDAARTALAAARAHSPRAVRLLEGAAAVHGGSLLEEDGDVAWALLEREEVEGLGRDVLRTLASLAATSAEPADALAWFARLLAGDPYDEAAWCELVVLLCRLGRYGEARRHYRSYRLRMAELDVPSLTWAELVGPGQEAQVVEGGPGRLRARS